MKPESRQSEIVGLLRAMQKELRVDELASLLQVSALTIRRDLEQLAEDGRIIRTHGGCIAAGRAALETQYHSKVAQNFELKQAVGKAAAEEVPPGSVILVNDGSTTYHVAAHLEERAPLTVYTNSIAMITDLGRIPGITLYILGGKYNRELYSLQGSLTEQILAEQQFDLCFIGADSVTPEGQCMVVTPEEASLTRAMLRRSRRGVLLADHTKCGGSGYHAYGTLKDFSLWITTRGVPRELMDIYLAMTEIKEA